MTTPTLTQQELEDMTVRELRAHVVELRREKAVAMTRVKTLMPLINFCLQLIDDKEHGRTPDDGAAQ